MPNVHDFSDVAVRIVEVQLAWVRVAGLLSVVIAALVATGVVTSVLRLMLLEYKRPGIRASHAASS